MKAHWVRLALTLTVSSALVYLYATLVWAVGTRFLWPLTLVEGVVIWTQLFRFVLFFAVPRFRGAGRFFILDVFALEVFALPLLAALALLTGSSFYGDISYQLIYGWVASLLLFVPPIVIFRYSASMYRGTSLSSFLPTSAFLFGALASLPTVMASQSAHGGPSALPAALLAAFYGVSGAFQSQSAGLLVSTVVAFFGVMLYATTVGSASGRFRLPALAITLTGVLLAFGWGVALTQLSSNTVFIFTLPTAAVGGYLWWSTREKP